MRVLIQCVIEVSVIVDGIVIGEIGEGFLIFVCVMQGDDDVKFV